MAQDVETRFLVRISVALVKAHPVAGKTIHSRIAKTSGQLIGSGLTLGSITAPATGIHPPVATSGSIHVNTHQNYVRATKFRANAVHPAATLREGDIFILRNKERSKEILRLEFGHNAPASSGWPPAASPRSTSACCAFRRRPERCKTCKSKLQQRRPGGLGEACSPSIELFSYAHTKKGQPKLTLRVEHRNP